MGLYGADPDVLQELALALRGIGSELRDITQQIRITSGRISRNPSLNKLGYPSMVREVGTNLESKARDVENSSVTLEQVASAFKTYEGRVITSSLEDTTSGSSRSGGGSSAGRNPFVDFLMGDLKTSGSLRSGSLSGEGSFLGIGASGAIGGALLGGEASLKPEAAWDLGKGDIYAGVQGSASGYLAKGYAKGDYGLLHGEAEGKIISGGVSGELSGSLFRNGHFDPSLSASASAKASVLSGSAKTSVGAEDNNVHANAKGDVLSAHASASAHAGKSGVGAKVEAGAYVAEGEISGGFNFMGLKVDVGLKGKAGGAGVEAGVEVGKGAIEGDLGIGLGLGAGVSLKIDYSGVPKAIGNWWNSLFK